VVLVRRAIPLSFAVLGLTLVVTLGPGVLPSAAAPTEPLFTDQIDGYADYDGADTCSPWDKPGTVALKALVLAAYPGTTGSIGRSCDSGGSSEHHEGRALDWMVSADTQAELAEDLLAWLLAEDSYGHGHAMARRLGVMYIIWNREVWRAYDPGQGWQPYSGSNPHTDHVHISMSWDGAWQDTTWSTGADVGMRLDQARFAATWRGPAQLDVFRRGATGALEQRTWAGSWSGWSDLGGALRSGPAAVWSTHRTLWVFGQGTDGTLHQRRWRSRSGWGPWNQTNLQISAAPAVAARAGRVEVVVRTDVGTAARRSFRPSKGWSAWDDLGGALTAPPAVVWPSRGHREVFARGTTGRLYQNSKLGGSWTGWIDRGGWLTSGPAATSFRSGEVNVYVRTDRGSISHRYDLGAGWSSWYDLGGHHVSGPSIATIRNDRIDAFTRERGGGLSQNNYRAGAGWSGWQVR